MLHSPSFCCSSCHHAHLFLFQFGWKFPPEIVLVIFYPNSHNFCFSFGFQGTPFSCSFLCPRFQTSLFSLFSAVCALPAFWLCPSPPYPFLLPSGSIAVQQRGLEAQGSSVPSPCISAAAQDGIWADEVYVWLVRMMPPPPIPPVRATPPPRPDN